MFKIGTLDQLAEITMGQSPKGSTVGKEGVPLLNGPTEFGENYPTPVQFTNDPKRFAKKGDLLFCVRGSTGKMNWADQDYAIGRGLAAIKPKKEFSKYFIKGSIEFFLNDLISSATGSVFTNVNKEQLHKMKCFIPSENSRKSIDYILEIFSKKIELNIKIKKKLQETIEAYFKSWFIDFEPVKNKEKKEITGLPKQIENLFPDKFMESEIGRIPFGWKVFKVKEILTRQKVGKLYSNKDVNNSGVIPVLDQSKDGVIGYHSDKEFVEANLDDPVFTFSNHTCNMRIMYENFSVIQNVIPLKSNLYPTLWSYIRTLNIKVFEEYKGHIPDFMNTKLCFPEKSLAIVFEKSMRPLFHRIHYSMKENLILKKLVSLLLPNLISGKFNLQNYEFD